jgi:cell division protein FtsI/penicillin-binding protein 2
MPLVAIAAASFVVGVYESGAAARAEHHLVESYVIAWARGDYKAMYGLLDGSSQSQLSYSEFAGYYAAAAQTATLERVIPGRASSRHGNTVDVRFRVVTREWGTLRETLQVPLSGSGSSARIHYAGTLVFPGLRPGEVLARHSRLGARGTLLADDGTPLAQGPQRTSPIPEVANEIVGTLGPIPADQRARYNAAGYPPNAKVGFDGLELIFQRRLVGRIGGTLLAGSRPLATVAPGAGATVRTTIDPTIEQAAITALGNSYAGLTVMDPRTGALLALAGIAFSDVQPPGSTMKIITSTAALQAGLTTIDTPYPVQTSATIDGYTMQNSNSEACGGTLINAFAVSCNSVFAPLGAELGGARLVSMAEKFGFDHQLPIAGVTESTIPSAATIGSALSVGSSAIGQGMVQASTLEMADVGATIAMGGRRPIPTLDYGAKPHFVHVTSGRIAAEVQQMMVAVVSYGTGTAAQIPGVEVAGKTGTAELKDTAPPTGNSGNSGSSTTTTSSSTDQAQNTDAWFVGYAPVGKARIVACALFPNAGFGGDTAAPVVREVMLAALEAHH